jgi:hypothetical protein
VTRPDVLVNLYGVHADTNMIMAAIVKYYENNPSKRDRTVVEVFLTGCK